MLSEQAAGASKLVKDIIVINIDIDSVQIFEIMLLVV